MYDKSFMVAGRQMQAWSGNMGRQVDVAQQGHTGRQVDAYRCG